MISFKVVERPRGESEGPGIISSVMRRRCDRSPGLF